MIMNTAYMRIIISCFLLTLAVASAQDVRTVSGKSVDIQPVRDWFANPKGERPMKHWKRVKVEAINGDIGGWPKCSIVTESGDTQTVLVKNLPRSIPAFFAGIKDQTDAIESLQTQIAADKQRREQLWNRYIYTDSSYVQMNVSSSSGTSVDSEQTRHAQAVAMDAQIANEKDRLASLEATRDRELAASASKLTVFAMFTGQQYGGVNIWDTGQTR